MTFQNPSERWCYLRDKVKDLPTTPGVYIFKNQEGTPIYVGKALVLRSRVGSYFRAWHVHAHKTKAMLSHIWEWEIIPLAGENEALIKENELIKKYQPHYNMMLRDDKTYPWVKVTMMDPFPRIYFTRRIEADGSLYYGPYPQAGDARRVVQYIIDTYKLRDCKDNVREGVKTPVCISLQIGKCDAPCQGLITAKDYRVLVKKACDFLEGAQKDILRQLKREMEEASEKMQYELAAEKRDMIISAQSMAKGSTLRAAVPAAAVVQRLQQVLDLPDPPLHIECFDISNTSGTDPVASLVVFKNGQASRKDYRTFKIRTVKGIDDFAMMREAVTRRYKRCLDESPNGETLPDLVMVDGGKGQLQAAEEALTSLSLDLPMIGLAKRFELIFVKRRKDPVVLWKYDEALQLLQRIRDESHRFAVTFHRKLRSKRTITSELENIPGIGPVLANRLLKTFRSVQGIKAASAADLAAVPGVSALLAANIKKLL